MQIPNIFSSGPSNVGYGVPGLVHPWFSASRVIGKISAMHALILKSLWNLTVNNLHISQIKLFTFTPTWMLEYIQGQRWCIWYQNNLFCCVGFFLICGLWECGQDPRNKPIYLYPSWLMPLKGQPSDWKWSLMPFYGRVKCHGWEEAVPGLPQLWKLVKNVAAKWLKEAIWKSILW